MQLPDDGNVYELVGGELKTSQAGFEHGEISAELLSELRQYVQAHKLGTAVGASTGFGMKTGGEQIVPGFSFPVADLFAEYGFDTEPLDAEKDLDENDAEQD